MFQIICDYFFKFSRREFIGSEKMNFCKKIYFTNCFPGKLSNCPLLPAVNESDYLFTSVSALNSFLFKKYTNLIDLVYIFSSMDISLVITEFTLFHII